MLLLDALVQLLWPPCCPRCGRDTSENRLCGPCRALMPRILANERRVCLGADVHDLKVMSLYRYEDPLRELVIDLKYRGNRHAGRGLVELLLESLPDRPALGHPDAVAPVPMTCTP